MRQLCPILTPTRRAFLEACRDGRGGERFPLGAPRHAARRFGWVEAEYRLADGSVRRHSELPPDARLESWLRDVLTAEGRRILETTPRR